MAASAEFREFPVIGRLIAQMKRLVGRFEELPGLRGMDDRQVGQIAHEFGLSRAELFTLCANKSSGSLLKQRLAEFGLTEELLAKKHPEVLQDLQRVCSTCTAASRCADDFVLNDISSRDGYCPNSGTLHALKQEGLGRKNESCCCGSCGSRSLRPKSNTTKCRQTKVLPAFVFFAPRFHSPWRATPCANPE